MPNKQIQETADQGAEYLGTIHYTEWGNLWYIESVPRDQEESEWDCNLEIDDNIKSLTKRDRGKHVIFKYVKTPANQIVAKFVRFT